MAVLVLTPSFTWGLFRRVLDTAMLRPQAPAELRVEPPTTLNDEEPAKWSGLLLVVRHGSAPRAATVVGLPGVSKRSSPGTWRVKRLPWDLVFAV